VTQAAKSGRPARRNAAPEISLVPKAEQSRASDAKPQTATREGVAPPAITVDDPWRYLHPSRVWPD
jgi:hypothetical protein